MKGVTVETPRCAGGQLSRNLHTHTHTHTHAHRRRNFSLRELDPFFILFFPPFANLQTPEGNVYVVLPTKTDDPAAC